MPVPGIPDFFRQSHEVAAVSGSSVSRATNLPME
jgi:hypothetical protein